MRRVHLTLAVSTQSSETADGPGTADTLIELSIHEVTLEQRTRAFVASVSTFGKRR